MRLTLVRHGETTGQSSIRYFGVTDVPLSEQGREQMRRVRAALAEERFDAAFSSRLSRSREGASIVAGAGFAVTPVAAFDEVDFGRWEGWTREEIAARNPEEYAVWRQSGDTFRYPDGETRAELAARVGAGLREVFATTAGNDLLMVLHRGVIAVILAELLGLDRPRRLELGIDLASIHVVGRSGGAWRPERLNDVAHLEGLPADR